MAQNRMRWFRKKKQFKCADVQSVQAEEERKDLLLWFSTKSRCPRDDDNTIDLSDECNNPFLARIIFYYLLYMFICIYV